MNTVVSDPSPHETTRAPSSCSRRKRAGLKEQPRVYIFLALYLQNRSILLPAGVAGDMQPVADQGAGSQPEGAGEGEGEEFAGGAGGFFGGGPEGGGGREVVAWHGMWWWLRLGL